MKHVILLSTLSFLNVLLMNGPSAAEQIEQFTSPSGVTVNIIKCSRKSAKCMNKAAVFCEGSYQVIDSESHSGGLVADILPGPVTWYSMAFLCGKSDGVMPTFSFRGPEPAMPSIVIPPTVRTTCTGFGNTVNCTSY